MKHFLLVLSFFAICTAGNAQEKNLFKDIDSIKLQLPRKPTLVYVVTPWCPGAREDIVAIAPAVKANRNNFNFIIAVDSKYYKTEYGTFFNAVNDLTPDRILSINDYYPTAFWKKKEGRQMASQFNSYYNYTRPNRIMGVSAFWITDCEQKLLKAFGLYHEGLEQFEKDLKELPKCDE